MAPTALYDEDILRWSEQQADTIRRLGRTRRDLPNELDVENVAEEIESVGRSELVAVETQIQNILVHLIKLLAEPDSDASRHWQAEILAFHADLRRRYAPSMRQRIDLDQLWRLAREQAVLLVPEDSTAVVALPPVPPLVIDVLLAERIDVAELTETLRRAASRNG